MANQREGRTEGGALTRNLALSLYLPAALLSLGTGIAAPVLPVYAKTFDVSFGTAALVLIVHAWGGVASTFPTGYLIDKLGRRPVLIAGPLLTALTAFLTATAGTFELLLVYRFINGAAAQMWAQSRLTMITDSGRDRDRGKMITWMAGTQRFGMLFAPVIGGAVAGIDIRAPFILQGLLVLLVLVPVWKLSKETSPVRSRTANDTGDWKYLLGEMRKPQILFFLLAQLFANLTRGGGTGIIFLYVAYEYGTSPQVIGLMAAGTAAIIMPMTFVTGAVMDRYGRKMTVVPGFAGLALFSVGLAAGSVVGISFGLFLALFYLMSASQGLTAGNMQVLGSDLAPERARGRFFSFQRLGGEVGSAMSPTAFSLLSAISYAAAFGFQAFCAAMVAVLIGLKVKDVVGRERPRGRNREEPAPEPAAANVMASAENGAEVAAPASATKKTPT